MRNYPTVIEGKTDATVNSLVDFARKISQIRRDDISDFNNLPKRLITGRKVDKIPAGSTDVDEEQDKVNDINWTDTYIYICIDNAGTAEWRRVALDTW
jgi:hypothetical protein